jgi:hypothetical protein
MRAELGMDITNTIMQIVEGIIVKKHGATLEEINTELVIETMQRGFLHLLKKKFSDSTPFLQQNFDLDKETGLYQIHKNSKISSAIPEKLRIKYYLTSFLTKMKIEGKTATFDDIVWNVMPNLKNGTTPENQTILKVLEDLGERVGKDGWQMKEKGQTQIDFKVK